MSDHSNRSQKIRRFCRGKHREEKIIQLAYQRASKDFLMKVPSPTDLPGHFGPAIEKLTTIIDLLQRQIFVLDNPALRFEIKPTIWHIPVNGKHHYLYKVVLKDDEEILYQLTWQGSRAGQGTELISLNATHTVGAIRMVSQI